jgi:thiol-disulfide isomerase/thioredoxin
MKIIYTATFLILFLIGCSADKTSQESSTLTDEIAESTDDTSQENSSKETIEEEIEVRTDFFIKDIEGNYYQLEDFKGKRVFINYWATWCKPCIAEMPDIEKAAKILEKENYLFFLVSDQPMSKIKAFKEKRGFNLTFAKLNGTMESLKIRSLPTTFIYDTEGNRVKQISGTQKWDKENVLNKLRAIQ